MHRNYEIQRFSKILIGSILFTFVYTLIWYKAQYPYLPFFHQNGQGLYPYYQFMNAADNVIWFLFMYFVAAHIQSIPDLQSRKSGFDRMVKSRTGLKSYYLEHYFWNFLGGVLLFLACGLTAVLSINFFCDRFMVNIVSQETSAAFLLFSQNAYLSLFISLILSSIGFGIYCALLYSLSFWISNINIFRAVGIILGMVLLFIPIIGATFPESSLISRLFSCLYLPNIISAGISGYGRYGYLIPVPILYCLTSLIYLFGTIIIGWLGVRHEESNG